MFCFYLHGADVVGFSFESLLSRACTHWDVIVLVVFKCEGAGCWIFWWNRKVVK